MPPCQHANLIFEPSEHAKIAGYKQPTARRLNAATQPSNKASKATQPPIKASTFPAPLVLPGDDLSYDPEDAESQSLKAWIEEPHRNEVTSERRTLYIVPAPKTYKSVGYVHDWTKPKVERPQEVGIPKIDDVVDYLKAFYHGLPVKLLSKPALQFVPWDPINSSKSKSNQEPKRIGVSTTSEVLGIRHRPSKDNLFTGQLNLDDLLDTAMTILPKDAYALIMLVEHDLYEDEEDDFCCGRAYGGSRVAVVSMARYNPALDEGQSVEMEHAWPASHCREYVEGCCWEGEEKPRPTKKAKVGKAKSAEEERSALSAAVQAFASLPAPKTPSQLSNLWLSRLCKTASHELGHCFGMDHCVYYACIMQGTAGLSEDARQPPYLCPVDLAKVLMATGASESDWCRSMLRFCEKFSDDRLFSAFAAWLEGRLRELEV